MLVQSSSLQADDPAFEAAIDDVVAALVLQDAVTKIRSPLVTENAGQISEDGRSALVEYQIRGDSDDAADLIDPVTAAIEKVQSAHPELFVGGFGDASADKALMASFLDDLKKAGPDLRPDHAAHPAWSRSERSWRPGSRCCSP